MHIHYSTQNLDEILHRLKTNLKKTSQVEEYDFIYGQYINSLNGRPQDINDTVIGLNKKIALFVFCLLHQHLLFPGKCFEKNYSDEELNILSDLMERQYSIPQFATTIELIIKRKLKNYDQEMRSEHVSKSRFSLFTNTKVPYAIYVMFGTASLLSFDSFINLLINDRQFIKIPISALFYVPASGMPHAGMFNTPELFIIHEFGHLSTILRNIENTDFNTLNTFLSHEHSLKNSLRRRVINIIIFISLFESFQINDLINKIYDMDTPKYKEYFSDMIRNSGLDRRDVPYIVEYFTSSFDVSDSFKEEIILKRAELEEASAAHVKNISDRFARISEIQSRINVLKRTNADDQLKELMDEHLRLVSMKVEPFDPSATIYELITFILMSS